MEIQRILFPQIGRCTECGLYFRPDSGSQEKVRTQYVIGDQKIGFERRGKVWFDTYFNGLSIEKWTKYTIVKDISLKLNISGRFKVSLINKEKIGTNISKKCCRSRSWSQKCRVSLFCHIWTAAIGGCIHLSLRHWRTAASFMVVHMLLTLTRERSELSK